MPHVHTGGRMPGPAHGCDSNRDDSQHGDEHPGKTGAEYAACHAPMLHDANCCLLRETGKEGAALVRLDVSVAMTDQRSCSVFAQAQLT